MKSLDDRTRRGLEECVGLPFVLGFVTLLFLFLGRWMGAVS